MMFTVASRDAVEILDSRVRPTLAATMTLADRTATRSEQVAINNRLGEIEAGGALPYGST
jgi:enolase